MFDVAITGVDIDGAFTVSAKSLDPDSFDDGYVTRGATAVSIEITPGTSGSRHKRADVSLTGDVCLQVPISLFPGTLYVMQRQGNRPL
jgi:hypothetical protein